MKKNRLAVQINKPVSVVFKFTITPPNSTLWIPSIVKEKTNEWPVRKETVYKLKNEKGEWSRVTVSAIKENKFVEWISQDKNYHCRYELKPIDKNSTDLKYYEWVDQGKINEPFTKAILEKLKSVLEKK